MKCTQWHSAPRTSHTPPQTESTKDKRTRSWGRNGLPAFGVPETPPMAKVGFMESVAKASKFAFPNRPKKPNGFP